MHVDTDGLLNMTILQTTGKNTKKRRKAETVLIFKFIVSLFNNALQA